MRGFVATSCAVLLFACAGDGHKQPQQPRADRAAATIDEAVALFVEMAKVVMSAADDCELMAARVGTWIDNNNAKRKKAYAQMSQLDKEGTEAAYRERLGEHLEVVVAMKAGIEGCQRHAGFVQAWNRLDE